MSKKITKVIIKGFKSHVDSEFTYAPGLTVVTGASDSGKSAGVMQPIKWVAFGEPSGESFLFTIRDPKTKEVIRQAQAAEVEIHLDDGTVIAKVRRKGKTAYYIGDDCISEKAEVPAEIKDILGLSKQEYGDFETSLNFAYQLEAPFLLSETASVGAKVLGKLAGTEIVDKAISSIMKRTHKARDEKNTAQKIIDQANVELVEYLEVDDLKAKIVACESLLWQIEKDMAFKNTVEKALATYKVFSEKLEGCAELIKRLAVVPEIAAELQVIELAQTKYDELLQLYRKYTRLEEDLKTISTSLDALKNVQVASTNLSNVEGNYRRFESLCELLRSYKMLSTGIESLDLEQYANLETIANLLLTTEQKYESSEHLNGLTISYHSLDNSVTESKNVIEKCKSLGKCSDLITSIEKSLTRTQLIESNVASLKSVDTKLQQLATKLKSYTSISDSYTILKEAEANFTRLTKLKQLFSDYSAKDNELENSKLTYQQKYKELQEAQSEVKAAWEAAGDVCPLCERPYDTHIHKESGTNAE